MGSTGFGATSSTERACDSREGTLPARRCGHSDEGRAAGGGTDGSQGGTATRMAEAAVGSAEEAIGWRVMSTLER